MPLLLKGQVLKSEGFTSKKGTALMSAKIFDGSDVFTVMGTADVMQDVSAGKEKIFELSAGVHNGFISYFVEGVK